ncbi:MAG: hypothetical protein JWP63_2226 [Candidatus Solibacter sp.]|jgi:hypothetical protein|nr:hypothetical protein [Candidatus Solibacter sp.]
MTSSYRNLLLGGLFTFCLIAPKALPAASGCTTSQLFGVYDAQGTNVALQNLIRPIVSVPPTTTNAAVVGFLNNPASLNGTSIPGAGRYYLDGTGNVTGLTAASSTLPAININVGTYTVNNDCSGRVTFTSGAAYDIYLSFGGTVVKYLRTDGSAGGEVGLLQRANSCVNLTYGGSFTFQVGGGSTQPTSTTGGTTALAPYSSVGAFTLNGNGGFAMTQSLLTATGVQRSTSIGTYTLSGDCTLTLSFATATGSNSTNFVAPSSFRVLMVDSTSGLLTVQPDANTTLTGTVDSQSSLPNNIVIAR